MRQTNALTEKALEIVEAAATLLNGGGTTQKEGLYYLKRHETDSHDLYIVSTYSCFTLRGWVPRSTRMLMDRAADGARYSLSYNNDGVEAVDTRDVTAQDAERMAEHLGHVFRRVLQDADAHVRWRKPETSHQHVAKFAEALSRYRDD